MPGIAAASGVASRERIPVVQSVSEVHEHEAFMPPPPGSEDREWPPETLETAMEWAREMRLQERGLALDDATLERVAKAALVKGDYADFWSRYTPEERGAQLPARLDSAVNAYLRRRPQINGGVARGWRAGREVLFVGIVGDLDEHRAALEPLAGGDRVVLEQRPRTVRELDVIAEQVESHERELADAGLEMDVELVRRFAERGVVQVKVLGGRDEGAAVEFFAARYGGAVEVAWLGPSRLREVPQAFGSWTSEGRQVRVFFGIEHNGEQRGNARVAEETEERVVIELTRHEPVGLRTLRGGFTPQQADLQLREPVGDRAVIDAGAGVGTSLTRTAARPLTHRRARSVAARRYPLR